MFEDARGMADRPVEADLCVIGAGAAGITLGLQFADSGVRVVILESGGPQIEQATEQLNANATVSGLKYPLSAARLRFLGGTTNHWSGHCYRFLERDFTPKSYIPNTGWPITLGDVAPYFDKASELALFRDAPVNWSPEAWRSRLKTKAWPLKADLFQTRLTFVSPPSPETGTRTFATHAKALTKTSNVRILQHANVTELVGTPDGGFVDHASVRTLAGNAFTVKAKVFVLAAGGVENARVMLASRTPFAKGIGNGSDNVGCYFTDHVVIYQDMVRNPDVAPDALMEFRDIDPRTRIVSHLIMTDAALEREKIDEVFLRVTPVYDRLSVGADAARRVQDAVAQGHFGSVRGADVSTAIQHPVDVARWGGSRAYCRTLPTRYTIAARLEPRPVRDSRVTLTDRRDAVGMPMMNLNWALAEEGKHSIHRALQLYAQEIGRTNTGRSRVTFDPAAAWPVFPKLDIGYHHTGTTRMSADPKLGVVDGQCRVHGVGNMYVAGSSVFPTSGSGSPTMMLTALSLRLADHLKREHFA